MWLFFSPSYKIIWTCLLAYASFRPLHVFHVSTYMYFTCRNSATPFSSILNYCNTIVSAFVALILGLLLGVILPLIIVIIMLIIINVYHRRQLRLVHVHNLNIVNREGS